MNSLQRPRARAGDCLRGKERHRGRRGIIFDALRKTGFELRSKDLQIYPDGSKKADWDVGMAVDAIRLSGSLDTVILVTGDGDHIRSWNILRLVWETCGGCGLSKTSSGKLKEIADPFIEIENSKILMGIRNR